MEIEKEFYNLANMQLLFLLYVYKLHNIIRIELFMMIPLFV